MADKLLRAMDRLDKRITEMEKSLLGITSVLGKLSSRLGYDLVELDLQGGHKPVFATCLEDNSPRVVGRDWKGDLLFENVDDPRVDNFLKGIEPELRGERETTNKVPEDFWRED